MPVTCHSRELTSPTVTDAWSLCCLLPVQPLTIMLVRRVARRDGMGRHDPLTTPRCGINGEQAPGNGAVPVTICSVGGTRIKEKKGPVVLEAFISLALLSLSLCVTCSSSSSIKGEAGCPRRGDGGSPLYTAVDIKTHALTHLRSTRMSETWDMSISRSFVTPTTNFQG